LWIVCFLVVELNAFRADSPAMESI
jgi:hypothetical protein